MNKNHPIYNEIQTIHEQLSDLRLEYFLNQNLFTFQWWILLIALIVPWIIWWKFVDRKRIFRILLYGALLMNLVIMLDDLGVENHLWSYPYQLVPMMPRLVAIDQGIIVVFHMFLYQYFGKWKTFILANAILAFVFSFIFEPLTVWLGIYEMENWRYMYSFPIYILKAILIKWLVDGLLHRKKVSSE